MKTASEAIIAKLAVRGFRITQARREVIQVLLQTRTPLTIQALAGKVQVDEATVYRTMAVLGEAGLAEEIPIRGKLSQFALAHDHHHHVVCRECGVVKHIDCDGGVSQPITVPGFTTINEHEVTYYGLCQACA